MVHQQGVAPFSRRLGLNTRRDVVRWAIRWLALLLLVGTVGTSVMFGLNPKLWWIETKAIVVGGMWTVLVLGVLASVCRGVYQSWVGPTAAQVQTHDPEVGSA